MTLDELQQWVDEDWKTKSPVQPSLETQLLFAIEEFGEVAEAIRKKTVDGDYKVDDGALGSEFADLLVAFVTLANTFDLNLAEEIDGFKAKLASRRT